jgi:ATP-binding cassette, subfamily B (MDR/TAP), member 1
MKQQGALDTESERIVKETLNRIMMNQTTIIVDHHLSTVRNVGFIAIVVGMLRSRRS